MEIVVVKEFNVAYEIAQLMCYSYLPDEFTKEKVKAAFADQGVRAGKLLDRVYALTEENVEIFEKGMVKSEADAFFFEDVNSYHSCTMSLAFFLSDNKNLLENVDQIDEQAFYSQLAMYWFEKVPDCMEEIVTLLQNEELELTPTAAWKLLLLFEKPKKYLEQFVQIIQKNLPAFNETVKKQRKLVDALMVQLEQQKSTLIPVIELANTMSENEDINQDAVKIIPSLAGSGMFYTFDLETYYAGYYFQEVLQFVLRSTQPIEDIAPVLKLLGDSSKFEILKFLKQAPNYNLEIAKHLGLTPATASHHMSGLFLNGLVTVEKINKKMYYAISEDKVREILASLEATLL